MQVSHAAPQKIIAIPARLASSRFPEKVLVDLLGKSMIQRTYEQALLAKVDRVLIVTDSPKIALAAEKFGAEVFLRKRHHESGTSRIAEAIDELNIPDTSLVLNLQADEPLISPANIIQVFGNIEKYESASVTTLCESIQDEMEISKPSCVKVVRDEQGFALYFSRSVIPYALNISTGTYFRHIGLYCFRAKFLKTLKLAEPSALEKQESLEQLSYLYRGHKIHVDQAKERSFPGIDLPSDVVQVEAVLRSRNE